MPIRRPSLGTILGSLALVVSMSGTAVAVTTAQSGDTLITQRSLSGNRLKHNTVTGYEIAESSLGTVPRAKSLPALVWHPLTLINGWTNLWAPTRVPAYAVDGQGLVHLRGSVSHPGGATSQPFANLPSTIVPNVVLQLSTDQGDGTHVAVKVDGQLWVLGSATGAGIVATSLDGLNYATK